jgi:putative hydrolase of the HAD superfamily
LHSEARRASTQLFDGAREALERLRARGVRLALVTNGAADIQREKLQLFSLSSFFDHIQIEGELGIGKPDEEAYFHAMKALGTQPAQTWMVGDNLEWEVAAPQRLGIHAIWHDHLGVGLPTGSSVRPDRIIRRISELLN